MTASPTPDPRPELPLFPLQSVMFPDSLLSLKVFEARYLDLIGACMRSGQPFGTVCLREGIEVQLADPAMPAVQMEDIGVLMHLVEVDADTVGILKVQCRAGQRFKLGPTHQRPGGLWVTQGAELLPPDPAVPPGEAFESCVTALAGAIAALAAQDVDPFATPHHLDHAGWVANRWCELLPISMAARQRLMALDDPLLRLRLVDEFLREKGVLG
jgi:Lon protease-like protein